MATFFISDLHLDATQTHLTALFDAFMQRWAPQAENLYILGDLFEVWVGDDDDRVAADRFRNTLRQLTDHGRPVFIMHGNRDFLLGEDFARDTGCTLLPDPSVIDLYGQRTLLMHGDSLCTDDVDHQATRRLVRGPAWQADFLARSLSERIALAREFRDKSRAETRNKPEAIMDVNQGAVEAALRDAQALQLIHGHTHRPAVHEFMLDGQPARRIVLGDWDQEGSVLVCTAEGCELQPFRLEAAAGSRRRSGSPLRGPQ